MVVLVLVPFLLGALSSPLFSRKDALSLANHPLIVQLGTGSLPAGSFHRCLLAHAAVVGGLEDGVASACSGASLAPKTMALLELAHAEGQRVARDADGWRATAAQAGRTIDLPESEVAAGGRGAR